MKRLSIDLVHELITQSLAAWHIAATVELTNDRAVVIGAKPKIRIEPAQAGSAFRWTITINGRTRPARSVLAVMRQVREALDPGYAACPVRIALLPMAPS